MGRKVTDYLLYRWRYILGYGVISLTIAALMFVAGRMIPGALTQAEMDSVVTSSHPLTSFEPALIINLPYHLLQHLSLHFFGVSTLSVKLPSLILGFLSIAGMFVLLRCWFRHNVAILTTLLIITTGQFLYLAQSGTPNIVYIFWSVWLLVAALMISLRARLSWLWKIILAGIIALSLYTPLSIYILIALASAVALHPHLRYIVRKLPKIKTAIAVVIGLALLSPLIYTVIHHPDVGLTLLGVPQGGFDVMGHVMQVIGLYLDFWSPAHTPYLTPLYGVGTLALILLGILRLFTTKYTARSYIITAWTLLLIPIVVINPDSVSITFVPALLLTAMGIASLLHMWYSLFPRNPYARIVGLIPLVVLMGGMLVTGVDRYFYGYSYDPYIAKQFSHDIKLLRSNYPADHRPSTLLVAPNELAFYSVVAKYQKGITVTTDPHTPVNGMLIVSHAAYTARSQAPARIVTDAMSTDADRFYIYKSTQQ